ncbi:anthrone oxygenase family protein [Phreatobacter sp. AB_2022a]|uniref:anthrone oxygenase family protein n=1 Tax=Phreatobacter sp. AB_2022a TaxID=3003134 RepID=UPI0022874958|nr:anthrone oxygenase family protein [Phreatobacter sp. AB_2022a]MCZ0737342.1 DUF1772 domain-containing protein [Phreatobacter sp. AB_2022a]
MVVSARLPLDRNHVSGALCAAQALAFAALLLFGAIAGFFYAYSVSVMRGLDAAGPVAAVAAMQGINATVRNAAFAPAFFGAPLAAAAAALAALVAGVPRAALLLAAAALVYLLGAMAPTVLVNVPMNDALAAAGAPADAAAAARLWTGYAPRWTAWNGARTAVSLASLALVGLALMGLGRRPA